MLPNTENAGDTFLALPFSGVMTEDQVDCVCYRVRAFYLQLTWGVVPKWGHFCLR